MALGTTTRVAAFVLGNKRCRIYDVTPSAGANYTTGGETVTPAAVGLRRKIDVAICDGPATTSNGVSAYTVKPLYQTDGSVKIVAHRTAAAVNNALNEAAANTDLSTFTVRITFIGN